MGPFEIKASCALLHRTSEGIGTIAESGSTSGATAAGMLVGMPASATLQRVPSARAQSSMRVKRGSRTCFCFLPKEGNEGTAHTLSWLRAASWSSVRGRIRGSHASLLFASGLWRFASDPLGKARSGGLQAERVCAASGNSKRRSSFAVSAASPVAGATASGSGHVTAKCSGQKHLP